MLHTCLLIKMFKSHIMRKSVLLHASRFLFGYVDDVSWISQFKKFPSLVIFHSLLRLPPSVVMELCCLVGGVLAIFMMVFRGLRCTLMFGILWILYLSLYKVCVWCRGCEVLWLWL